MTDGRPVATALPGGEEVLRRFSAIPPCADRGPASPDRAQASLAKRIRGAFRRHAPARGSRPCHRPRRAPPAAIGSSARRLLQRGPPAHGALPRRADPAGCRTAERRSRRRSPAGCRPSPSLRPGCMTPRDVFFATTGWSDIGKSPARPRRNRHPHRDLVPCAPIELAPGLRLAVERIEPECGLQDDRS